MTQRDARLSGALPPLLIVCGLCVYLCVFATCIQNISQQTEIEKATMYVKVCTGGIGSQMACQRAICFHVSSSD